MVTLVILDGFGYKKSAFGNAIKSQGTPFLDELKKNYPFTLIKASGEAVGLPNGVMGNSEVGHLTLGSGRVLLQDLLQINLDIENGNFYKNPALNKALIHAEKNNSNLHIMGLLSDGKVHSDISHLFAILDATKNYKIKNVYIHVITDGRDTGVADGAKFVDMLEDKILNTNASIATVIGRIYAMDREKRFDRIQKFYDLLFEGKGEAFGSAKEAVLSSYNKNIFDEFIEPCVIKDAKIQDNDSLIFYNYRADRAREITSAIIQENFDKFKTKKVKNLMFTAMTEYDETFKKVNTMYPPKIVEDNLSAVLSKYGKRQFHTSETTKYAHVTFFFNGGIDKPYANEERKLIDSVNVKDFSEYPKMRAPEIKDEVINAINSKKYDFILVNFSNPDMLGHTGNFEATKEAIKCVDELSYQVAQATLRAGGDCIITADHGNAEEMFDKKGNKITTHTTNSVPFILVSEKYKKAKLKKDKSLTCVAATILKLMDLEIPKTYDEPIF